MASYNAADVKCPFYRRDDPKTSSLTCEGVLPGSSVKSHFGGKKELQRTIRRFCAGDYKTCPWYKVASLKWIEPEH